MKEPSRPARRRTFADQAFLRPQRRRTDYLERRTLRDAILAIRPCIRHGTLLDVGCGIKPYQGLLANEKDYYLGIDYPITMEGSYRDLTRADVFADCQRLPVRSASVDTVICTQVLEHVPRPHDLVHEIARVIRPEGRLVMSAPMVWPEHEVPHDYFRYTLYGMRYLLARAGFEIIREIRRGAGASTLAQLFLDLHLASRPRQALPGKIYTNLMALGVNCLAPVLDGLLPSSRFYLGTLLAAQKPLA